MIVDAFGRAHSFEAPPQRVISLVPSLTETLFDLGAGDQVVGATAFCIFPASALQTTTRVGGTKNPDVEQIRALRPDLVHMNLEENLERHARTIEQFAPVFLSEPKGVRDVAELIRTLGVIHDARQRAGVWADDLERELEMKSERSYSFLCAIWKDPWMWCGGDTYVSDLISCAGGRNLLESQLRYPRLALEEALALGPDIVFLPDEPYVFTTADAEEVQSRTGGRVVGPFPGHLVTWHGTRTVAGLRFLRGLECLG